MHFDNYDVASAITAHRLDDCVETWVWSSMHGTSKLFHSETMSPHLNL